MSLTLLFLPQGPTTQHVIYPMTGGAIVGGAATLGRKATIAMSGGAIAGGEALPTRKATTGMTGGAIAGGAVNILGTLGRSGGGASAGNEIIFVDGRPVRRIDDTHYTKV